MPQGLQIWDATGTIILDTTDRLGRIIGSFTITNGMTGTLTPAKQADERFFIMGYATGGIQAQCYPYTTFGMIDPAGPNLFYYASGSGSAQIYYGVY
jgi:hypothetical protein